MAIFLQNNSNKCEHVVNWDVFKRKWGKNADLGVKMPILGVKLKLFSLFRGEDACFRGENLHVWDENGLYGVNDALEKCCDR